MSCARSAFASRSARRFVRVNTSVESSSLLEQGEQPARIFSSCPTKTPAGSRAPPRPAAGNLDAHGIAQVLLRELCTSAPMVAEKSNVCRSRGTFREDAIELRLESMSSMRSASSRTR